MLSTFQHFPHSYAFLSRCCNRCVGSLLFLCTYCMIEIIKQINSLSSVLSIIGMFDMAALLPLSRTTSREQMRIHFHCDIPWNFEKPINSIYAENVRACKLHTNPPRRCLARGRTMYDIINFGGQSRATKSRPSFSTFSAVIVVHGAVRQWEAQVQLWFIDSGK